MEEDADCFYTKQKVQILKKAMRVVLTESQQTFIL